jgi:hypothetical protein
MERSKLWPSSLVLLVLLLHATAAAAADPERISLSSLGTEGHPLVNSCCESSAVSADGRFVAFGSNAPDFVPGETNRMTDVFVRDRLLGTTARVSVSSTGEQGNSLSIVTGISADGRYVAFWSLASNLVPDDTNGAADSFVHDRANGTTVRAGGPNGEQFPQGTHGGAISSSGRFLVFVVPHTTVIVRDRDVDADGVFDETGATSTTSLDLTGAPVAPTTSDRIPATAISANGRFVAFEIYGNWGNRILIHDRDRDGDGTFDEAGAIETIDAGAGSAPSLTPDGRFAAFHTRAALVPEDTNGTNDVYVYDRLAAVSTRVSVTTTGAQLQTFGGSYTAVISATGRFIAFISEGPLVPHDSNHSRDIYLRDRDADQDGVFDEPGGVETVRVSESPTGNSPPGFSGGPAISLDGTHVTFSSFASDLVAGDTNGAVDVFIRRRNVAPVLGGIAAPQVPVAIDTQIALQASFTDVNTDDTYSALWSWGDGTTSGGLVTATAGTGQVSGAHAYPAAGVYTVTLDLTDAEGAIAAARYEYIVVYDPTGGFVSGNGLLASPPGAFTADPALAGPARVSFVSKYQKGTNAPDGNMQFDFKTADFSFRSSGYAWLVVAGARAQIKGTGSVNGAGNYGFLLTVIDGDLTGGGGTDRVRVKIWDSTTGTIVYDNQLGAADDAAATTAITGGSIVIHK